MRKFIFFRTDRIGDFLVSLILIQSIKRNEPKAHITVVASNKNYSYIKSLNSVDETILYPNKIFKRLIFFFKLINKKYNAVFILDGKKRSIYSSILIKSKLKFLLTTKILYKKLLKLFFYNIIYEKNFKNKLEEIKYILSSLKYNFSETDLNLFTKENISNKALFKLDKKPILLHFDEKWIFNEYIQKYNNIEPNDKEFKEFLEEIIIKTNNNLFITTGLKSNNLIENIKRSFTFLHDNTYALNINNKKAILLISTNFSEIKRIISQSELIICCHGAVSHVAAGLNKKIIDIYDHSEEEFYNRWTSHFRNYNFLYRESFNKLSKKIISKLN